MERIYEFLPMMVMSFMVIGLYVYLRMLRIRLGDFFERVELEIANKNQRKKVWKFALLLTYVFVPISEELIFRAPLIIAFDGISINSWYVIIISSILFALMHIFEIDFFLVNKKNDATKRYGRIIYLRKKFLIRATGSFFLGLLCAYYGVKYQSVWLAVAIHSTWNFLLIALGFLATLMAFLFDVVMVIWEKLILKKIFK